MVFNELLSLGYMEDDRISVSSKGLRCYFSTDTIFALVSRRRRKGVGTDRGHYVAWISGHYDI